MFILRNYASSCPLNPIPMITISVLTKPEARFEKRFAPPSKPKWKTWISIILSSSGIRIGGERYRGLFATFLTDYDFSGKLLVPFCTNEGSRMGRSESDIKELCPQSTLLEGLPIRGSSVNRAQKDVADWLHKIGII